MKKFVILILSVIPCLVLAQKSNLQKYLKGMIPMENGQVIFNKTFEISGNAQADAFNNLLSFTQQLITDSKHKDYSKITLQDKDKGFIVANVCEYMYFHRKAWNEDFADFFYRILITVNKGNVNVKIQDISYNYEKDYGLKAEQWITDKVAISKNGQKLRKDTGKFRIFTIDRVEQMMSQLAAAVQ